MKTRSVPAPIALALLASACGGTNDNGGNNPPPATPPRILELTPSSRAVAPGATVTLTYRVENATSVSLAADPGGTLIESSAQLAGTASSLPIQSDTRFTLTARGDGGMVDQSVMVSVTTSSVSILTFRADPNPGPQGGMTTLSWSTRGADRVRVRRGAFTVLDTTTMVAAGTQEVTLTVTSTTYTLEASRGGGMTTLRDLIVTAVPLPRIKRFEASPSIFLAAPATVTLNWEVEDADTIELFANDMKVPTFPGTPMGTFDLMIREVTRFDLVAANQNGTVREMRSVSRAVSEVEPNNTFQSATDVGGGAVTGMIMPATDQDWFQVVVPAGGSVYAQTSDGMGSCAFDTRLALYRPDGMTKIGENDEGGLMGGCSEIDPRSESYARDLPAGTYFVVVTSAMMRTGAYTLIVRAQAPACGNGFIERGPMEQCDDGNTTAMDGCSATCTVESSRKLTGLPAMMDFRGGITSRGEVDVYAVQLGAPGSISAQLSSPMGTECTFPGSDLILGLRNERGMVLGTGSNGEVGRCSAIDPARASWAQVPAGTYLINVSSTNPGIAVPMYTLRVRTIARGCGNSIVESGETCDDGNTTAGDGCNATCQFEGMRETEPNDDMARATRITPPTPVGGSIMPGTEADWFRIDVPAGGRHLEAYLTVASNERCSFAGRARLSLYGMGSMNALAQDEFSGPDGNCGSLSPANAMATQNMPQGTYFLVVQSSLQDPISSYVLHTRLIANACGNGVRESGEQCDDGNTANGDGCSSMCRYEIAQTVNAPGRIVTVDLPSFGSTRVIEVNVNRAGQSISAISADPGGMRCSVDTTLSMLDPQRMEIGVSMEGGPFPCGGIVFPFTTYATDLAPGSYLVIVRNQGQTGGQVQLDLQIIEPTCGDGVVERRAGEACDDQNTANGDGCSSTCRWEPSIRPEVEPNDMRAQATPTGLTTTATVTVAGSVSPIGDYDWFSFVVPAGGSRALRAQTYGTVGNVNTCLGDTVLALFDANGTMIAENDNGGNQLCSRLDDMITPAVGTLAPGMYFLRVQGFMNFDRVPLYFLGLELR